LYVIRIDGYTFGLHTHNSIAIYSGDSIKAVNLIGVVDECPEEKMNDMLEALGYFENTDKP
jgi:hypothetical protein